jgi:hypothetical protein
MGNQSKEQRKITYKNLLQEVVSQLVLGVKSLKSV